jgi:hypothetical protein
MTRHRISPRPWGRAAIILCILTGGSGAIGADEETRGPDVLAEWMTGTFSSAAQAAEDPEFFDVSLHVAPIWTDRDSGRWLYVEQAVREAQDRPYRQRVYRVDEVAAGLFEIQVLTLPDPAAVVGAWREESPLDDLTPDDLEEREGCSIVMRRRGDTFIGSTLAWLCTSTLRGAAYATSDVMITPDGMVSWDRGFAEDQTQVWGSVKGGYVFDRIVDDTDADSASASENESDGDSDADLDLSSEQTADEIGTENEGESPPE